MEQSLLKPLNREQYMTVICIASSIGFFLNGFINILSGLILVENSQFYAYLVDNISSNTETTSDSTNNYCLQFILSYYIGQIIGSILASSLTDNFGRKTILLYSTFASFVVMLWMTLSSISSLFTIRFILGWLVSIMMISASLYISEVSMNFDRGSNIIYLIISSIFGSIIAIVKYSAIYSLSGNIGWRLAFILPIIFVIAAVSIMTYLPESPRWLLARKTPSECLSSLRLLRRSNDVSLEFNDVYLALTRDARLGDSWLDILQSRSIFYRFIITLLIQLLSFLIGIQIVSSYAYELYVSLGMHSVIMGLTLATIAGLGGSCFSFKKIDYWGRRFVLFVGLAWMSISLLGMLMCIYSGGLIDGKAELYLKSFLLRFLFGSFLSLYALFYYFSIGSVGFVIMTEIFPLRFRGKIIGIVTTAYFTSNLAGFLSISTYLNSDNSSLIGKNTTLSLITFIVVIILLEIILYISLPETQGIMLEEMEDLFEMDGSTWCGFCPLFDSYNNNKNSMVGLRVLNRNNLNSKSKYGNDTSTSNINTINSSGLVVHNNSNTLSKEFIEPNTLHKYSNVMKETRFQYYQQEEQESLLDADVNSYGTVASKSKGNKSTYDKTSNSHRKNFLLPDVNV